MRSAPRARSSVRARSVAFRALILGSIAALSCAHEVRNPQPFSAANAAEAGPVEVVPAEDEAGARSEPALASPFTCDPSLLASQEGLQRLSLTQYRSRLRELIEHAAAEHSAEVLASSGM